MNQIARRRMANSRLTGPPLSTAEEVVHRHGAMQAQDYGPTKWSIAQRAAHIVDDDIDRSLSAGSIIRTHVLRPTWHFVAREDVRRLLALTGPRVAGSIGPRLRELGLDTRTLSRCETLIGGALRGGNSLTRDGIAKILRGAGIDGTGQRLPHILMHCELEAVICSGGLAGKRHTYALFDERVPDHRVFDRDRALAEVIRRYLTSHGPATVKDVRWWSSLTVADIKRGLDMLGAEVQNETIQGLSLWSMASDEKRAPAARGVHLLHAYDELLVGYSESRHLGDPRAAQARAAWKDRSLPNGVVLVNAHVAGYWRRTAGRASMRIDALLYDSPKRAVTRALEDAVKELERFVQMPVTLRPGTL